MFKNIGTHISNLSGEVAEIISKAEALGVEPLIINSDSTNALYGFTGTQRHIRKTIEKSWPGYSCRWLEYDESRTCSLQIIKITKS